MTSRGVLGESALRMSDCVTELLRKQPFFGSLVLRLPLRADPTRKTLASDGQEIRYSPGWVAETDAHLIETAMARVVMACALKHHTRRGERDPERWQTASQLVTHALLRDAGFTLPSDAEAWEDLSVEQAYDRLPESGGRRFRRRRQRILRMAAARAPARLQPARLPASDGDESGDPSGDGQDEDGGDDADSQDGDGDDGHDGNRQGRGRLIRVRRRAMILPAPARSWTPTPARASAPIPARSPWTSSPKSRRGTRPCTRPSASPEPRARRPGGVAETIRNAHTTTLDWRTLLRRYMTDAAKPRLQLERSQPALHRQRASTCPRFAPKASTRLPSSSTPRVPFRARPWPTFWAELREVVDEIRPERIIVLQVDAALRDAAEYAPDDLPDEIALKGRGGTDFRPGFEWLDEQAIQPTVCLYFTDMECSSYPEAEPAFSTIWVNWGPAPSEWNREPWGERIDIGA